jgi:RNA polymerase sigma factor (sigma-70 family)
MSSSALAAGVRHLRSVVATQCRHEESDEQLLNDFAVRRDESAFAALVRRHGPMVLGVCRRVLGHVQDAEDVFQAAFLVLARRAGGVRDKAALASFLHGTAYRLALSARRAAARRRKHEAQAPARPMDNPSSELLWREVQTLLDEEIARLPDAYRNVFILCCLESLSRAETAQRLELKEGTVSSRLTEARKRLQKRLARRGVELTALLAAGGLTAETASALPLVLLTRTTRAAISPAVAVLGKNGPMILSAGKVKLATALVVAASLLTGAGLWLSARPQAAAVPPAEPPASASTKPKATPPRNEAAKTVEIKGRVLGADGKPKAGAKLRLLATGNKVETLGTTTEEGRFTVAVPKDPKDRFLIADAAGAGLDFLELGSLKPDKPVEFRLVKDRAIRGKVVNTEGKPVAGVRVTVFSIGVYANNSMDSFLTAWKKRHFMSGLPGGVKSIWDGAEPLFTATTDAQGRFTFHGAGSERLVRLRLRGSGIADSEVWIVNRDGFDPKPYNQASLDNIPKGMENLSIRWLLYGPEPSAVVESEKPIRGVVKESDTGKGRPGVLVRLTRREGGALMDIAPEARTDSQGRYEIHGARKMKRYMLEVAGDAKTGYMACQHWIDDTAGYQPLDADITVKKGVIVTGKLLDGATRKPVHGYAMAAVLNNNPFVKDFPEFNSASRFAMRNADADATFRLVTLPGPVLLMGGPNDWATGSTYKSPAPDPKYPQYFTKDPHFPAYYNPGGSMSPIQGNFCKVLEIKADAKIVEQDIVLERASALPVRIQDADGKPLRGVWVAGSSPQDWYPPIQCKDAECSAYQIQPGKPRLLVFFHKERKLAAALTLKGDEKPPVVAKLGPAGAIKGRLLDADGKPLAGVALALDYRDRAAGEIHGIVHESKHVVTDAAGAFALDELVPEVKFTLSFRSGRRRFEHETKPADPAIQVKAGEVRDLGAIKLKPVPEKENE